jgi:hypothetical protein
MQQASIEKLDSSNAEWQRSIYLLKLDTADVKQLRINTVKADKVKPLSRYSVFRLG